MNEKKKAYLISASDHYSHRFAAVDRHLRLRGYDTTYITSDFDHTKKAVFSCSVPGCVQLHARPYKKNLSVDRILSHYEFARETFRYLEALKEEPDVIVVLLPPNFLAHYCGKYKKRHPKVKLIFDIFDLWPETFPSGKLKKLLAPVFDVWAWLRDHNLLAADYVTTECEMFRQRLGLSDDRSETVYLSAEPLGKPNCDPVLREDGFDLCYLGAINNVIDIPAICGLIGALVKVKPVTLHIIGQGERQQELIDGAKASGAEVVFYGAVYEETQKKAILGKCHFGLNIMKSSVCIGLTMKSVDYFRYGLPIINTIPADTEQLVAAFGIGIHLDEAGLNRLLEISNEECLEMRKNVNVVFDRYFSSAAIDVKYQALLDRIL